jgi:endoglucanase
MTNAIRALCRTHVARLLAILVAICSVSSAIAPTALARRHRGPRAGVANAGLPSAGANPLSGMRWGIYRGSADNSVYPYYARATGFNKWLLGKIALRPMMFSFGAWYADDQIESVVQQYIANITGGDPTVLSQMAVFRLDPWEGAACSGSWDGADQASYENWINNFAAGIGSSRVALILQPDLAFATCAPSMTPLNLVKYAARRFSQLPHTTVYIDGGVHWWPMQVSQAVWMLEQAGVKYVRGFALNTSEYDATGAEIEYGVSIAQGLSAAGQGNKHFVINTAENGAPFLNGQYPGGLNGDPRVCNNRSDTICATLGIPPTTDVANPRWHLSGLDRNLARGYVDAYVWAGRPWLDNGAYPFDMNRALGLASSSPF